MVPATSDAPHPTTTTYFWFEDVSASCEYNYVYDDFEWHIDAVMGGDYEEISEVVVWFHDPYTYRAVDGFGLHTYGVGQTWDSLFSTYYYACGSSHDLEFVAYNAYGDSAATWILW